MLPGRCCCRHSSHVRAALNPPPSRPQQASPGSQPRRPTGTGARPISTVATKDAIAQWQQLWQRIRPTTVKQDLSTGLCLPPDQPGHLGQPVQLLTNHLTVSTSSAFTGATRYCIKINTKAASGSAAADPNAAATAAQPSPATPQGPTIALDVRQQLVAKAASQQGWQKGRWQYDPSSNRLFSLDQVEECTIEVTGVSSANSNTKAALYEVTVSNDTDAPPLASAPGTAAESDTLQLLSMLLKSSLLAALPQPLLQTPRALLLPQGALGDTAAGPAAGAGRRGRGVGDRGGRSGARGGGRMGGRGGSGGVLQFWDGLRPAVKAGQQSFAVQLDTTKGGVLPAGQLSDLLVDAVRPAGASTPADLCGNKRMLAAAEAGVKGVKIQVTYFATGPQSRVVKGLDARTPEKYRFTLQDGSTTTVAQYFKDTYPHLKLGHLHDWPCVMTSNKAAIPLELCSVFEPQPRKNLTDTQTAELIRLAAQPPEQRKRALQHVVGQLLSNFKLDLLKAWGITVSPQLLKVPGRVLPDAKLQYAANTCVDAANTGQWRTTAKLLQPPNLQSWAVLNLAGRGCTAGIDGLIRELCTQISRQGGSAAPSPSVIQGAAFPSTAAAVEAAARAAGRTPQLLLVVLPSDKNKEYNEVKHAAAQLNLVTQCVVATTAGITDSKAGSSGRGGNSDVKPAYVANLLLKITAKVGGVGWQLPQGPGVWAPHFNAPLMVLGIDVGHGVAGGSSKPSIASVVGSVDASCSRYSAVVLEQTSGHEIVLGLREAVVQLLRARSSSSGAAAAAGYPGSLLVYRDGVSDSQYLAVLQEEVAAIRQACVDVGGADYKPKLTFLVVSKSHGTRLFPDRQGGPGSADRDRSGNVLPGTVVDTIITAPLKYEWFHNSHAGIQGTNRPGRYNVLVDDSQLGPDGLQLITQHLASTYAACTRTISCPAPVRYADKAARAGSYLSGSGPWNVLRPGGAGMQQLQYRMLSISTVMADKMWFV